MLTELNPYQVRPQVLHRQSVTSKKIVTVCVFFLSGGEQKRKKKKRNKVPRSIDSLFLTYTPLQESLELNSGGHLLSLLVQVAQEASTL